MAKFFLALLIALGLGSCKTKTVRDPALTGGADTNGSLGGFNFKMPEFLLTTFPEIKNKAQLRIKTQNVYPVPVRGGSEGEASVILVVTEPELSATQPDYAQLEFAIDRACDGQPYRVVKTSCSFMGFFAPPACKSKQPEQVTVRVRSRACVDQNRSGSCGKWSDASYFKTTLNVNHDKYRELVSFEQNEKSRLDFVNNHLFSSAKTHAASCNQKTSLSDNDKMLCVVANNIANRPHQMCAVYATEMSELFAEMARGSEKAHDGARLAETTDNESAISYVIPDHQQGSASGQSRVSTEFPDREKVINITNSLQCAAAGKDYEWVNAERSCYRIIHKSNHHKIHKKWINDQSLIGGFMMFATLAAGSYWVNIEYERKGIDAFAMQSEITKEASMRYSFAADQDQVSGIGNLLHRNGIIYDEKKLYKLFEIQPDGKLRAKTGNLTNILLSPESEKKWQELTKNADYFEDGYIKQLSSDISPGYRPTYQTKKAGRLWELQPAYKPASAAALVASFATGLTFFVSGYMQHRDNGEYNLTEAPHTAAGFRKVLTSAGEKLAKLKRAQCELGKKLFSYCYMDE